MAQGGLGREQMDGLDYSEVRVEKGRVAWGELK